MAKGLLSKITHKSILNRVSELVKEKVIEEKERQLKISEVAAIQFIKAMLPKLLKNEKAS
ncbi:hypothetical protein J4433_00840 [Candidatus Pacearchaeota archaeon]|nr:hypothetical protein [Candidatus Pacearchaeota archaeon]